MKKIVIVGLSMVLATLPVLGAFAEGEPQNLVDTLDVTINQSCTLENGDSSLGVYVDREFSATALAGTVVELAQTSPTVTANTGITVTCNAPGVSWHVTAVGEDLTDGTNTFSRGTATSGSVSEWAFKLGVGTYADWSALPTKTGNVEPTVLSSNMSGVSTTFNPKYRVYVAPAQPRGTYSGSVTYTLVLGL